MKNIPDFQIMENISNLQINSQNTDSFYWMRRGVDRRSPCERRFDRRDADDRKRSIISAISRLIKLLTNNPRLGVDRRKGGDPRTIARTETIELQSLLSPEEIEGLLK